MLVNDWELRDISIKCVECGDTFTFTANEQHYYLTRTPALAMPKRCSYCRLMRKLTKVEGRGGVRR